MLLDNNEIFHCNTLLCKTYFRLLNQNRAQLRIGLFEDFELSMDPIALSWELLSGFSVVGKPLLELLGVIDCESTILKAICRKDLQSSISHFRRGVEKLNLPKSIENKEYESLPSKTLQSAKESFIEADREAN